MNNNIIMNTEEVIKKDIFTSLELVELINQFREREGNRKELRHDTLLNIIREEFEDEKGGVQNILETHYTHPQNKQKYPMYVLNLQQSRQVLVRESKFVRRAVIEYIDKLESELRNQFKVPQNYIEALELALSQAKLIESQRLQLEEQESLVTLSNNFLQTKDTIDMGDMAKVLQSKEINIGRNRLFEFLREENILMKSNVPYQRYIDQGYFDVKEVIKDTINGEKTFVKTLVTPKGQMLISNIVKERYSTFKK